MVDGVTRAATRGVVKGIGNAAAEWRNNLLIYGCGGIVLLAALFCLVILACMRLWEKNGTGSSGRS